MEIIDVTTFAKANPVAVVAKTVLEPHGFDKTRTIFKSTSGIFLVNDTNLEFFFYRLKYLNMI